MGDEAKDATEERPSRGIALLLGFIGPWGTGQFYLGQTKRALRWLVIPSAVFTLCVLGFPWLGRTFGYGPAFGGLFLGTLGTWLASLIDLRIIPEVRLRRAAGIKVFGYWVAGVLFTIAVRVPIRAFVLEAYKIPSRAMQPALLVGDHIAVDKLALNFRKPKRGEAIVFEFPENREQDFVKRVIAIPGDTLLVKDGHPRINGWEVPHCFVATTMVQSDAGGYFSGDLYVEFLDGETYLTFFDGIGGQEDVQGPYVVAANEVWVLGDDRNNSHDSRSWFGGRGGGVPLDHVRGRALFRWLGLTDEGVDWSRFGTALAEPLLPASMKALERDLERCLAQRPPREETLPPARTTTSSRSTSRGGT